MECRTQEKLEELSNLAVAAAHGFVFELMRFGLIKADENRWFEWLTGKAEPSAWALEHSLLEAVDVQELGHQLRWKDGKKHPLNEHVAELLQKAKAYADAFETDEAWLLRRFGESRHELFPNPQDAILQWHWDDPRDDERHQFGLHATPTVCHVHGASAHGFVYSLCTQFAVGLMMYDQEQYADCFLAFLLDDRLEKLILHQTEEPHLNNEFAALRKLLKHSQAATSHALSNDEFQLEDDDSEEPKINERCPDCGGDWDESERTKKYHATGQSCQRCRKSSEELNRAIIEGRIPVCDGCKLLEVPPNGTDEGRVLDEFGFCSTCRKQSGNLKSIGIAAGSGNQAKLDRHPFWSRIRGWARLHWGEHLRDEEIAQRLTDRLRSTRKAANANVALMMSLWDVLWWLERENAGAPNNAKQGPGLLGPSGDNASDRVPPLDFDPKTHSFRHELQGGQGGDVQPEAVVSADEPPNGSASALGWYVAGMQRVSAAEAWPQEPVFVLRKLRRLACDVLKVIEDRRLKDARHITPKSPMAKLCEKELGNAAHPFSRQLFQLPRVLVEPGKPRTLLDAPLPPEVLPVAQAAVGFLDDANDRLFAHESWERRQHFGVSTVSSIVCEQLVDGIRLLGQIVGADGNDELADLDVDVLTIRKHYREAVRERDRRHEAVKAMEADLKSDASALSKAELCELLEWKRSELRGSQCSLANYIEVLKTIRNRIGLVDNNGSCPCPSIVMANWSPTDDDGWKALDADLERIQQTILRQKLPGKLEDAGDGKPLTVPGSDAVADALIDTVLIQPVTSPETPTSAGQGNSTPQPPADEPDSIVQLTMLAESLGQDGVKVSLEISQILSRPKLSVDKKMRQIFELHPSVIAMDANWWASQVRKSRQAVEKTKWWKQDRKTLLALVEEEGKERLRRNSK